MPHDISALIGSFRSAYDAEAMDQVWKGLSQRFHRFWDERVLSDDTAAIPDAECDEIIRILDRNGKNYRGQLRVFL